MGDLVTDGDNIRTDIKELGYGDVDQFQLAQKRDQLWAVLITVICFWFIEGGEFLECMNKF